jgi:hypothetical protein
MAKSLYLTDDAPSAHRGDNTPNLRGTASWWFPYLLSESRGSNASYTTMTVNTVTGPTNGIEVGSPPIEWISEPLSADFTISGAISANLWALESSMSANAATNFVVDLIDGTTGAITNVVTSARTTETGTTAAAEAFTATPASGVAAKKGDRLRIRVFCEDAGVMATGYSYSFYFDHNAAGTQGDSYITFTENLTFETLRGTPSGSQYYLTSAAESINPGAATELKALSTRGSVLAAAITNTVNGPTNPVQITASGGGSALEWYTPGLQAVTIGGRAKFNVWAAESNAAANASIRGEIAICNADGTGAVVWAAADADVAVGQGGEIPAAAAAVAIYVSGDDVALTAGQRLRFRIYTDDMATNPQISGYTITVSYNGASGGTNGDTYVILPVAVTESGPGAKPIPGGAISGSSSFSGSIRAIRRIPPLGITATSSVSGVVGVRRKLVGGGISGSSGISGAISKAVANRRAQVTWASLSVPIAAPVTKPITGGITGTSSIGGSIRRILTWPKIVALPMLSGSPTVGSTLTVTGGTWGIPTIQATSTISGAVQTKKQISGAIIASSGISGRVSVLRKIAGVIQGTSSLSGGPRALRAIRAGQITGTSSISGLVGRIRKITSGVITGTSAISGAVTRYFVAKAIAGGVITGTSSLTGAVLRRRAITGAVTAISTISGAVRAYRRVTGGIAGTSSFAVVLTKGGTQQLTVGGITGTSSITATMTYKKALRNGVITGTSSLSGSLRAFRAITAGIITGLSTISGGIVAKRRITGGITGTSTISAALAKLGMAQIRNGVITGTSSFGATLGVRHKLVVSSIPGISTISGSVTVIRRIAGGITGISVITATVKRLRPITPAVIIGTSSLSGGVRRIRSLVGAINATSTLSGHVAVRYAISGGQIIGMSSFSGNFAKRGGIRGAISATSTISGQIRVGYVVYGRSAARLVSASYDTPTLVSARYNKPILERVLNGS